MDDGAGNEIIRMEIGFWDINPSTGNKRTFMGRWDYKFRFNDDGTLTIYDRSHTPNGSNNQTNYERRAVAPFLNYFCYVSYTNTSGFFIR